MTRLWPLGQAIDMATDGAGVPRRFEWLGKPHPVESIANHWKVDTAWWVVRQYREYWKLMTQTGLLVVVYRDLVTGCWYLQRLYD